MKVPFRGLSFVVCLLLVSIASFVLIPTYVYDNRELADDSTVESATNWVLVSLEKDGSSMYENELAIADKMGCSRYLIIDDSHVRLDFVGVSVNGTYDSLSSNVSFDVKDDAPKQFSWIKTCDMTVSEDNVTLSHGDIVAVFEPIASKDMTYNDALASQLL